jgi:hypothetical protein
LLLFSLSAPIVVIIIIIIIVVVVIAAVVVLMGRSRREFRCRGGRGGRSGCEDEELAPGPRSEDGSGRDSIRHRRR